MTEKLFDAHAIRRLTARRTDVAVRRARRAEAAARLCRSRVADTSRPSAAASARAVVSAALLQARRRRENVRAGTIASPLRLHDAACSSSFSRLRFLASGTPFTPLILAIRVLT